MSSRPFVYEKGELVCEGVSLNRLAHRYGTPLYVYSADQMVERVGLFDHEFASVPHVVCYAVKANSALGVLKLLARRGCGFDIVSGGELERVIRAAGKSSAEVCGRVVFSGVGKQAWEIDLALHEGILQFNVESEEELELLAERAARLKTVARFALRVNPDVFAETHPYISTGLSEHKFGIDIQLARKVYARAKKSRWLEATGVSVHIGSQIRRVDPFASALERVVTLIQQLRKDGHAIRYADAGGGLGIDYGTGDFDPAKQVSRYARALKKSLGTLDVTLLLEPGRFIVAQAGALVSEVLFTKKNGTKTFVIVDGAMNDLIRPALYHAHHEIVPLKKSRARTRKVDVVGPVCESGDFFARDRELPALKKGDAVAVLDAGAYGLSLSSNYNTRVRPAEVMIEKGKARLIRRRETLEDLFAPEII